MSRSMISYHPSSWLLFIQNRKTDIRLIALDAKQACEALAHDEDTEDLRVVSDLLMGYAQQIAEMVKVIEQAEAEI